MKRIIIAMLTGVAAVAGLHQRASAADLAVKGFASDSSVFELDGVLCGCSCGGCLAVNSKLDIFRSFRILQYNHRQQRRDLCNRSHRRHPWWLQLAICSCVGRWP